MNLYLFSNIANQTNDRCWVNKSYFTNIAVQNVNQVFVYITHWPSFLNTTKIAVDNKQSTNFFAKCCAGLENYRASKFSTWYTDAILSAIINSWWVSPILQFFLNIACTRQVYNIAFKANVYNHTLNIQVLFNPIFHLKDQNFS
mgnify:CR=1 FL=1